MKTTFIITPAENNGRGFDLDVIYVDQHGITTHKYYWDYRWFWLAIAVGHLRAFLIDRGMRPRL